MSGRSCPCPTAGPAPEEHPHQRPAASFGHTGQVGQLPHESARELCDRVVPRQVLDEPGRAVPARLGGHQPRLTAGLPPRHEPDLQAGRQDQRTLHVHRFGTVLVPGTPASRDRQRERHSAIQSGGFTYFQIPATATSVTVTVSGKAGVGNRGNRRAGHAGHVPHHVQVRITDPWPSPPSAAVCPPQTARKTNGKGSCSTGGTAAWAGSAGCLLSHAVADAPRPARRRRPRRPPRRHTHPVATGHNARLAATVSQL